MTDTEIIAPAIRKSIEKACGIKLTGLGEINAAKAVIAALTEAGMAIVLVEPTEDMLFKGFITIGDPNITITEFRVAYKAMIGAGK